MRIGIGYDVHRFQEGRKLILGGVDIPADKSMNMGLLGHSDADVLVHAIMDALLGAAALGDIGRHFPDSDESFKNISSILLLERVKNILGKNGYTVSNIDSVVAAQKPKLSPHIDDMRASIAAALGIDRGAVSVKATTTEGLGFEGRLEGISAQAVCIIKEV